MQPEIAGRDREPGRESPSTAGTGSGGQRTAPMRSGHERVADRHGRIYDCASSVGSIRRTPRPGGFPAASSESLPVFRSPVSFAHVAALLLVLPFVVGCRDAAIREIRFSERLQESYDNPLTGKGLHDEQSDFRIELCSLGRAAVGDSFGWRVEEMGRDPGKGAMDKAWKLALQDVSIRFALDSMRCARFGNAAAEARARIMDRLDEADLQGAKPIVDQLLSGSSFFAGRYLIPAAEFLWFAPMNREAHEEMRIPHPELPGLALPVRLDLVPAAEGFTGVAKVDEDQLARMFTESGMPEEIRASIGRVGRRVSIRRTTDSLILVVSDTLDRPGSFSVRTRTYRTLRD